MDAEESAADADQTEEDGQVRIAEEALPLLKDYIGIIDAPVATLALAEDAAGDAPET